MAQNIAARVQKHRDSLRSLGLRPIQIWVPDTRKRGFRAECRRQSLSLGKDNEERNVLEWIESISDHKEWK